jgi:hypothetical protein
MVDDSSAREKTMHVYIVPIRIVAMKRPPQPPSARPKFQPAKSPEMTYATPRPASRTQPAAPFFSCRFSM